MLTSICPAFGCEADASLAKLVFALRGPNSVSAFGWPLGPAECLEGCGSIVANCTLQTSARRGKPAGGVGPDRLESFELGRLRRVQAGATAPPRERCEAALRRRNRPSRRMSGDQGSSGIVELAPGHDGPGDAGDLVGDGHGGELGRLSGHQPQKPGRDALAVALPGVVDPG